MSRRKKYRIYLFMALLFNLAAIGFAYIWIVNEKIPDQIMLTRGIEESLDFNAPVAGVFSLDMPKQEKAIQLDFADPVTLTLNNTGTYSMKLKLFGLIDFKNIEFQVVDEKNVIPGGENIGIYVEAKGVMVLGTGEVTSINQETYRPAENIIKSGDYILRLNNIAVEDTTQFSQLINEAGDQQIVLNILRGDKTQDIKLQSVETKPGNYKLGIWVRDDTQGVGTITYRTEEGDFGALGHGITDGDTGLLMKIEDGTIYETEIIDILKGQNGKPGEVVGIIRSGESMKLGQIDSNTECGIFGQVKKDSEWWQKKEAIPIGHKQEIKKGKASILCQLDGQVEEYEIEIEKIKYNSQVDSKGMVIKITDEKLLKKTNGIIQGMSGSPIIQNGKLIGAVTHVFIQDSAKGYGIFIENMIKK